MDSDNLHDGVPQSPPEILAIKQALEVEKLKLETEKLRQDLHLAKPDHRRPATWLNAATVLVTVIAFIVQTFHRQQSELKEAIATKTEVDAKLSLVEHKQLEIEQTKLNGDLLTAKAAHAKIMQAYADSEAIARDSEVMMQAIGRAKTFNPGSINRDQEMVAVNTAMQQEMIEHKEALLFNASGRAISVAEFYRDDDAIEHLLARRVVGISNAVFLDKSPVADAYIVVCALDQDGVSGTELAKCRVISSWTGSYTQFTASNGLVWKSHFSSAPGMPYYETPVATSPTTQP